MLRADASDQRLILDLPRSSCIHMFAFRTAVTDGHISTQIDIPAPFSFPNSYTILSSFSLRAGLCLFLLHLFLLISIDPPPQPSQKLGTMHHSYIPSGRRLSKLLFMPLVLLLLATAVGVCNASPLPDEARKTRPSPVKESVLTQQPCSLRQVGQTLGKLLCLPFQGVGPSNFLLGYTWTRGKSERKAHPDYRDSDSEVNRLYKLCDVLEALVPPDVRPDGSSRHVRFDYYFPEPDYFRSPVVPAGSRQASLEYLLDFWQIFMITSSCRLKRGLKNGTQIKSTLFIFPSL
ncbi:hypothetical protein EV361DRAFT_913619 [Lentinula raphanica]|nr:hypothetical protein EV361DRAFT_913619 [Lentinula raphanica]